MTILTLPTTGDYSCGHCGGRTLDVTCHIRTYADRTNYLRMNISYCPCQSDCEGSCNEDEDIDVDSCGNWKRVVKSVLRENRHTKMYTDHNEICDIIQKALDDEVRDADDDIVSDKDIRASQSGVLYEIRDGTDEDGDYCQTCTRLPDDEQRHYITVIHWEDGSESHLLNKDYRGNLCSTSVIIPDDDHDDHDSYIAVSDRCFLYRVSGSKDDYTVTRLGEDKYPRINVTYFDNGSEYWNAPNKQFIQIEFL